MDLAGKNVLITGAARGIGAGTARALAARGARLALVGLEPDKLAALAADLGTRERTHTGVEHVWAEADVTDSAALRSAAAKAVASLGGLDVVVAGAGIASFGTVRTIDPEAFAKTIEVNLTGVFRTVQATLPYVIEARGYLLVVSSLAALVPTMGFSGYGASKAGLEAFANALRIELAPVGVTVGCAHLSWVDTDMVRDAERDLAAFRQMRGQLPWPLRATTPVADCAAALVRAIERRSRRVYVPRATGINHWIRPLVHSGPVEVLLTRRSAKVLALLEAEITALGRSTSERIAQIQSGWRR